MISINKLSRSTPNILDLDATLLRDNVDFRGFYMSCECSLCSMKIDFEIDRHLLEEIESGRCVIFAGSGISTETKGAHLYSFYDDLKNETQAPNGKEFWEIIDIFQNRPNGRQKLIEKIRDRFDYIDGWRELRETATRFHKSIATAPYFHTFITTNWDLYFEKVLNATPFVHDSDLAFWEHSKRKVLKIHGSIDNLSTIVASTDDYGECERRLTEGPLGNIMSQTFATKTVLFAGYSAKDSDFLNIYNGVVRKMGKMARSHYLVSPFLSDDDLIRLKSINIIGIKTDATHLIEQIKNHMCEKFCYATDNAYEFIFEILNKSTNEHTKFTNETPIKSNPHLFFCIPYQDGLIHGFQRIWENRYTDSYSDLHKIQSQILKYNSIVDDHLKHDDYWNSSYFDGYTTALEFFLVINLELRENIDVNYADEELPLYYHPKHGPLTIDEFKEKILPNPKMHKRSLTEAKKIINKFNGFDGIVPHHSPFG